MKKKVLAILACFAASVAFAFGGVIVLAKKPVVADTAPATYGLYASQTLATARGGKTFALADGTRTSVIKCHDGGEDTTSLSTADRLVMDRNGVFSTSSDTAYAYNAGNIGETPSGSTYYQTYGNSELFFAGHSGGWLRGIEWILTDSVSTEDYSAISFDVSYITSSPNYSVDCLGDVFIYALGTDINGQTVTINQRVEFGVNYWTTGVIEFSKEMVSVERIAISVIFDTFANQTASGSYVYLTDFTVHARGDEVEQAETYNLWATDALASANGGQKFALVSSADAQIYTMDGTGDGLNQANRKVSSDANGYYSMQSSGAFIAGYPGGVQRGGEWLLAKSINTAQYESISVDVGYVNVPVGTPDQDGCTAYIYALGTDENGARKVVNQKVEFGVGYYTTGTISLDGLKTVERIAVSVLWGTVTSVSNAQFRITNFTVNARTIEIQDVSLTANGFDFEFYNGNQAGGQLSGKSMRVFHNNTGYSAFGNFNETINDGGKEYIHGTQRMSAGSYVTLRFKEPIKASRYKYFDVELLAYPQSAENSYLAETATEFTYTLLPYYANDTTAGVNFTLKAKTWAVCRVNLADFADGNGYVNSIKIRYTSNSENRESSEESKYSIQMGIHNARLTNDETKYTQVPLLTMQSKVKGAQVALNDDIIFRYSVELGEDLQNNPTATFTVNGVETTVSEYTLKDGAYVFAFDGITPKMLGDEFDFKVTATSKSLKNTTVTVVERKGYTVKAYLEELLVMDGVDGKTKTLVVDLLNYGAAAQTYSNYKTETLVNADLTAEQKSLATAFDEAGAESVLAVNNTETVSFKGARLWLDSEVNIGLKIALAEGVDKNVVSVKVTIGGVEHTDVTLADNMEIIVSGISATQFHQTIWVEVLIDGVETGATCTYSVNTYVARTYNAGNANADLAKALYCYGVSAKARNS